MRKAPQSIPTARVRLHGIAAVCYAGRWREGGRANSLSIGLSRSSALNRSRIPDPIRRRQKAESIELSDIVFDPTDMDGMLVRLEELRARHRELDTTIERLEIEGGNDIQIMGLKREKLRVKDRIAWLSSKITPDIIA